MKGEKGEAQRRNDSRDGEVCPSCGHVNERYALRCDSCGALIDAGAAPAPGTPTPPTPPTEPEEQKPPEKPPPSIREPRRTEPPAAAIVDPSPPKAHMPSAPPPVASVSEEFKLCDKCAAHVPEGSPTCPSCGALLRAARSEIAAHQQIGERFTGTFAIVLAIASMALFRFGPKFTLAGSGLAIVVGILAFRRDEQAGLGILALILGILAIFGVIVSPMFHG
ncbi:MAG: hypothetical protein GXP25_09980 [Planctomycetes bacterium]|nr:hypothetical protein [Planctomycetota bacterium]